MIRLVLALLLFAFPAAAGELKFATWNLEWLTDRPAGDPDLPQDVSPKRGEDIALLRRYAETLDADVVAFQEVDGPRMAGQIFPPDRYVLHITGDRVVQRVGLAIRRGIAFTAHPDLAALDVFADAPRHLRTGADVTLDLPGTKLRVLAVHLKTGCQFGGLNSSRTACAVLHDQVPALSGWIAARAAEGVPFVVMGDFNRWMNGRDQLLAALQRAAPLARATEGHDSPCWGGEHFIDHILAGGPARAWLEPDSLRVTVYRETGREWKERLSDHCPVSVRMRVPE